MRRLLPLLLILLALSACGGKSTTATQTAKAAPDPARALAALIDAAHRGDDTAVAAQLMPGAKATASELGEGLGTFVGKTPHTLYRGGDWAVAAVRGTRTAEGTRAKAAYAVALHLVGGRWRADLTERTTVRILGPRPGMRAAATPQVAAALQSHAPLAESGLWIDGRELIEKGGGSPTRGDIYGAPEHPLAPGVHVAVAYARDAAHGSAVAWIFRV